MVGNAASGMNVAVIGAGAAGLATARALTRNGVGSVTVLEKDNDPGGVWRYTKNDESRPMYRGLRTNLPREVMAYREKPWGGDRIGRSYVTHKEVYGYLKEYSKQFSLQKYISYGCIVTQLTVNKSFPSETALNPSDSPKITLEWQDDTPSKQKFEQSFDAVCICNGHYASPAFTQIPGLNENFKGEIMHSVAYDDPSAFVGKTVLCIGGRASGSDLAREISFHAGCVYLSDSAFDFSGDQGSNVCGNVTWLPRTMEFDEDGGVHFENIQFVLHDVDVIIFCSGYDYKFPFINEKSGLELCSTPGERRVTPLYENLFHAQYPNIAFIGLQHSVLPFPYFELQADAVTAQLIGSAPDPLPTLNDRLAAAKRDAESGGPKGPLGRVQDTHYLGGYQWDYCRKMAKMAGLYNDDLERYIGTNKAIYDHSGKERKSIFPGGPDSYRYTGYVRDEENVSFESFKVH
eukprot:CAMPEP_0172507216 /NCGR_PEP_ID=MMETSP1066-20121228/202298_1 /TAXON_ID=671091 /ORGANISM="Coscinodiscus wailesii, Strain CCMP2513" /LENGTH=460 /DNA_ID=CAMNT_0013284689 /DNA_START=204 /DNA_END=1586 /DNA_ORIENTATION=-